MSAQETYGATSGYIRHQGSVATTAGSVNSETKRVMGKDFAEYYNTSSAVGLKPLRSTHQGTSVMKVNEGLGSINIVTQNLSQTPDGFVASQPKEAKVVDMNM